MKASKPEHWQSFQKNCVEFLAPGSQGVLQAASPPGSDKLVSYSFGKPNPPIYVRD
jgi:hypothetical protein